jgi:hypothetical protein
MTFTDSLPKDTLVLTADLTTAELAEALAGLRFQHGSRCLVSLEQRCARLPSPRHRSAMTPRRFSPLWSNRSRVPCLPQ